MKNLDIGVFDSGIGGLTVLKVLLQEMPEGIHFHYFADTARVPYGSKPPETIRRYVKEIMDFFTAMDVKAIVTACNTSDSLTGASVKKSLDIPYFSIVDPVTVTLGMTMKPESSVAIIGTENTVRKSMYLRKLITFDNVLRITQKACPLFVPLVEEGIWEGKLADTVAWFYLNEIKKFEPDYLIMGCTHYPILRDTIEKFVGDQTTIVDPAIPLSKEVKDWANPEKGIGKSEISFYVSGNLNSFKTSAMRLLGRELEYRLYHVDLSERSSIEKI